MSSIESKQTEFKQDVREMGKDAERIKRDMGNLAHHTADAAKDGVTELRHGAEHAVDVAKDKFQEGKEAVAESTESLRGTIARNPFASVGIAAGAGAVLALIMFRPRG
ncbi:MAG: DUF883 family protein [Phycisphaerales bacterium]|nr:MAG: DUF883 family protein [Phycisphaerales bacterium]